MPDTYSEILADFVCSLDASAIPEHTRQLAYQSALDAIGVTLAGHRSTSAQAVVNMLRSWGGHQESTILGYRVKSPAHAAAFANGVAHHSIELDDHTAHTRSFNHPGVVSFPAAYAVGERQDADGERFMTAAVSAYEINSRLNAAVPIGTFNFERGFHGTALTGPFGSAAACAVLTGATREQLVNAFGICGSTAAGSYEFKVSGAWTKRFHAGWASQSGVQALDLARHGFTGPRSILEGPNGFYATYARDITPNLDILTEDLGKRFEFDYIMYKPFSCAGVLHSPLTAAQAILQDHEFSYTDISSIRVRTNSTVVRQMAQPVAHKTVPQSTVDAQFSLQYAVAALFRFGRALLAEFSESAISDRGVLHLASLVDCSANPAFDERFPEEELSQISVHLRDGRVLTASTNYAKGSLGSPMTEDELRSKFHSLTEEILEPGVGDAVQALLRDWENLESVRQITKTLSSGLRAPFGD